jgi:hypothetical protein
VRRKQEHDVRTDLARISKRIRRPHLGCIRTAAASPPPSDPPDDRSVLVRYFSIPSTGYWICRAIFSGWFDSRNSSRHVLVSWMAPTIAQGWVGFLHSFCILQYALPPAA